MLLGRIMAPTPESGSLAGVGIDVAAVSPHLVVDVRPASFSAARLAADVTAAKCSSHWMRLPPYEVDVPRFASMAEDLVRRCRSACPRPIAVVEISDPGQVDGFVAAVGRASPDPPTPTLVLRFDASESTCSPSSAEVDRAIERGALDSVARESGTDRASVARLVEITCAGMPLVGRLLQASRRLPQGDLARLARFTPDLDQLTQQVTSRLLHRASPEAREMLGLVALLGYCHESYSSMHPVLALGRDLPWWTPLDGGWLQVDRAWRSGLFQTSARTGRPSMALLTKLVSELVADHAVDDAIELCLDVGSFGLASDLLTDAGLRRLADERPAATRRWLGRLPDDERGRLGLSGPRRETNPDVEVVPAAVGAIRATTPLRDDGPHRRLLGIRRWAGSRPDVRPSPNLSSVNDRQQSPLLALGAGPIRPPALVAVDTDGTDIRHDRARAGALAGNVAGSGDGTGPTCDETVDPSLPPIWLAPRAIPTLDVRLFGDFEVRIDGAAVEAWRGRNGRLILAYLLLGRPRTFGRDALADVFWRDALPQASRNRLNVTLHGLRLDVRAVTEHPIVVFRHGYAINPDLVVHTDVEEFEQGITAARARAAAGDGPGARDAYRDALVRYRDDLLTELPYEEWTILRREQLRVSMLDALSYITEEAFAAGGYEECIDAGQRLVAADLCREDVHRLLMKAYARLEQPHRAMRQYRACQRQLGSELGVGPSTETVRLFDLVRARRPV